MQRNNGLLARLWNFLGRRGRPSSLANGALAGSQRPVIASARRRGNRYFEIDEVPMRPVGGSVQNAIELIEMRDWSYEASHAIERLASDCFQSIDGSSETWTIESDNAEVKAIAEDLQKRRAGRIPIIGGDRTKRGIYDALWAGDGFLELEIGREGISRNDYCLTSSNYLPSLSVLIDEDDHGAVQGYWQPTQFGRIENGIFIHPLTILNFQYGKSGVYGTSMNFPALDTWRKVKEVSIDIEDAARALSTSPWLHEMPEGADTLYKDRYKQEIEDLRRDGIITDLYLMPGGDVRRAANGTNLEPLVDYWLKLRYQCIPPSIPLWLYPGLGLESNAGREIANQPAMAYARTISQLRSIAAAQIEWAISIEIVLRKGFDWYEANANGNFMIKWSKWFIDPIAASQAETDENGNPIDPGQEDRSGNENDAPEEEPNQSNRLIR